MSRAIIGDYQVSQSAAVAQARSRFENLIKQGREGAVRLLNEVNTRAIRDALPTGADLAWAYDEQNRLTMKVENTGQRVHRHALGQLAARAGIPGAYLNELATSDNANKRALAVGALRTHYHATDLATTSHLVRCVDGEARAVLSDSYKRLDSRPLLETFAEVCQQYGAIPTTATASDVRMQLKAYLPHIFEPVDGEVMLIGLAWSNSDFGAGAHGSAVTILRLNCYNGATGDQVIRQVHAGRRLDAQGVRLSQETLDLETKLAASVLKDTATEAFGPERVNGLLGQIRSAATQGMTWETLRKRIANGTSKGEQEAIKVAFEGADTFNLPAGQTAWRASNAVSWIAGQASDADRKLDLERLAGALMMGERAAKEVPVAA